MIERTRQNDTQREKRVRNKEGKSKRKEEKGNERERKIERKVAVGYKKKVLI